MLACPCAVGSWCNTSPSPASPWRTDTCFAETAHSARRHIPQPHFSKGQGGGAALTMKPHPQVVAELMHPGYSARKNVAVKERRREHTWLWSGNGMMEPQIPRIIDGWISQCVYLRDAPTRISPKSQDPRRCSSRETPTTMAGGLACMLSTWCGPRVGGRQAESIRGVVGATRLQVDAGRL